MLVRGQQIIYNGDIYLVLKDDPSGTPDTSSDYLLLSTSTLPPDTMLFNVVSGTGTIEVKSGDDLILQSNTLDITLQENPASVDIELPQGPSEDVVPLSYTSVYAMEGANYLYFGSFSPYIITTPCIIESFSTQFVLRMNELVDGDVGSITYDISIAPIDLTESPVVFSRSLSPTFTDTTPLPLMMTDSDTLSFPVTVPSTVIISNFKFTATGSGSYWYSPFISGTLFSTLTIK